MQRLSDLLNPAPSSAESPAAPSTSDSDRDQSHHVRHLSLSSPLEALALATSNGPIDPATQENEQALQAGGDDHNATTGQNARAVGESPVLDQPSLNARHSPTTAEVPLPQNRSRGSPLASQPEAADSVPMMENSLKRKSPSSSSTPARASERAQPGVTNATMASGGLPVERGADSKQTDSVRLVVDGGAGTDTKVLTTSEGTIKNEEDATMPLAIDGKVPETARSALPLTNGPKKVAPRADRKKGTASTIKKPVAKKRKIETASKDDTAASQRSTTPTSSRASKTPASKTRKQDSATPAPSSPLANDEDDEDMDEDTEVFCICRKPDDHQWMIGCDGGCEDWFHGRCIEISQRDENLIDKYICPNCSARGAGVTTWKPMCRLDTCRNPARAAGPNPSKYCSDAHGELYMRQRVLGKDAASSKQPPKKKRKEDHVGSGDNAEDEDDQGGQAHLRGGTLRPGELKALASGVDSISEFKRLGDPVSNQLRDSARNEAIADKKGSHHSSPSYTSSETAQLETISKKRDALQNKLDALKARERFAELIRARAKGVLDEMKKKEKSLKDICGYDARLSWSDKEFDEWRCSIEGHAVLETGTLGPPGRSAREPNDVDGDPRTVHGEEHSSDEFGAGVCQKKRCERHKQWYKLQIQEVAFEKEECRQGKGRLDKEEKGVKERAVLRGLESQEER